jgi:mycofactocin precursor peptide peptidase
VVVLADQSWVDVRAEYALLVIPVGATEQHGPHLPLSTDTDIAVGISMRLAGGDQTIVVAPAVPYGSSGEHQDFAGTLSIGSQAIEQLLLELVRSATVAFPRVLLVSCHGGNAEPVGRVVAQLQYEGRDVRAWSPALAWAGDAHAGLIETSVMLTLHPDRVRMDLAEKGNEGALGDLMPALREQGVAAVSPNGILGDSTGATRAKGDELLSTAVEQLSEWVEQWLGSGKVRG